MKTKKRKRKKKIKIKIKKEKSFKSLPEVESKDSEGELLCLVESGSVVRSSERRNWSKKKNISFRRRRKKKKTRRNLLSRLFVVLLFFESQFLFLFFVPLPLLSFLTLFLCFYQYIVFSFSLFILPRKWRVE